jgi:hypothetical protein
MWLFEKNFVAWEEVMSETAAECLRIELSVFASATRRGNRYHVGGSADMDLWKGPGIDTILVLVRSCCVPFVR